MDSFGDCRKIEESALVHWLNKIAGLKVVLTAIIGVGAHFSYVTDFWETFGSLYLEEVLKFQKKIIFLNFFQNFVQFCQTPMVIYEKNMERIAVS